MPESQALTGGGVSLRPLPDGLSGCVKTAATSTGEAVNARSVGTANSDVPKKTTRMDSSREKPQRPPKRALISIKNIARAKRGILRGGPGLFLEAALHDVALRLVEVIENEFSVQMIDFML